MPERYVLCHITEKSEELLRRDVNSQSHKLLKALEEKFNLQQEILNQANEKDAANMKISNMCQNLQKDFKIYNIDRIEQLKNALSKIKSLNKQLESLDKLGAEFNITLDISRSLESETLHAEENCVPQQKSEQQCILNREREKLKGRCKFTDEQNNLLLDQIQQLTTQLNILQAAVTKQLEETKSQMEVKEQETEVSVLSGANHETLNAITNSNKLLTKYLSVEIITMQLRVKKLHLKSLHYQKINVIQ
ncbi:hypothetical protein GWI33_017008 [Rhynchophorus ferrugineus]|uniref:Uncharacterized protein n=1 Tax=Rhynchophorus ferrugineus TaxID=354439 RepID=A0A834I006_RHYFE|nr:hypothetical protein GWI33_017008 [Rhynchophorus ferrugineus]